MKRILSWIGNKGDIIVFVDGIRGIPFILPSVSDNLYFPIIICKFTVAGDISKFTHIIYILIPRFDNFDEVSLFRHFLNNIKIFHHEFTFILH